MHTPHSKQDNNLTFGGHLEVLRQMLFRVLGVCTILSILIFCFKEETFRLLLAPREWDFVTYRTLETWMQALHIDFRFSPYHIDLISTDLSAQFMTHLSSSVYLGLLIASPYILFELFRFITPALYEREKKYSVWIAVSVYLLFALGVVMNYYIIFPISFRFLGTYQVDPSITSTITLSSYISTFTTLTFVMGLVFQLPVMAFILGKLGLLSSTFMARYRRHAFILILIVSAIITPPDVFTLILVSIPIYLLYEVSIWIIKQTEHPK